MGIATAVIADAMAYQQVLKAHKTVFMLFVSHCPRPAGRPGHCLNALPGNTLAP
ncbi:hypothetical protein P0D90_00655 [Pseudomonas sp. CBSPCBW29]|nr:hypothetical protein P0D90_00655 [Pseudomonas sp. CBSPCBW29]